MRSKIAHITEWNKGLKTEYESEIQYKEKKILKKSEISKKNSISQIKCSLESHTNRIRGKYVRAQNNVEDL